MAYADIIPTLKTLLEAITIPPSSGEPSISHEVLLNWPDIEASKGSNGQIKPAYSIIRSTLANQPVDNKGRASRYIDTVMVDCWCTQFGNEPPADLMERMVAQLRGAIDENNENPNASAYFMHVSGETPFDEPQQSPPLHRTRVLVSVYGMR